MKLKEKIAIVTGGGRGIGRAVAEALANEGAKVIVCSRSESELKEAAASAKNCEYFVCDVSDEKSAADLVENAVKKFGRIDILVAAAGVYGPKGLFHSLDSNEWKKCFDINFFGTLNCIRSALPHLRNSNGCVVAFGGAKVPQQFPMFSAYSVSKSAIVQLITNLASEYSNVRFFAVAPGAVNTKFVDEVIAAGPDAVGKEFFEKNLAYKRGENTVDAGFVADFIVSLAADSKVSGKYLSPSWDKNIEDSPPHMFTLQRIDGRNFDKKS